MPDKQNIQALYNIHNRRLQILKQQQAMQGINTPPHILLEIEDLETQMATLQEQFEQLGDAAETGLLSERPSAGNPVGTQGHTRVINTGGGAYIEGAVSTSGGDFVGRDKITTTGLSANEVANLFAQIYSQIDKHADLEPEDKADLKAEVAEVETEVTKTGEIDETFLTRRLRSIKRMAPDIFEVVAATLTNPAAGFNLIAAKVAKKIQASTGG